MGDVLPWRPHVQEFAGITNSADFEGKDWEYTLSGKCFSYLKSFICYCIQLAKILFVKQ